MQQETAKASTLDTLRARIARVERSVRPDSSRVLPFRIPSIDDHLPGGGLPLGALHEMASAGPDVEHGTVAALLVAGILARMAGPVLWVLEQSDLFAPALDAVGLCPDRVLYADAGKPKAVLAAMEEGLRHNGLAGVVGEISGRLTLTASRRLQLAAEQSGVTCFALRRSRTLSMDLSTDPIAAATRWRVQPLPSPPPLAHAPETPGLGPPRWRLDLIRCRGGEAASWIVEASHATGHLGLSADLADRPVAAEPGTRRAAQG